MAAPLKFDRQEILAAALRLLDREGADGMTMRSLARDLGLKAPSLYNHFKGKRELLDGLADVIVRNVRDELDPEAGWDVVIAQFARALRRALLRHRDGGKIFAGTFPVTHNILEIGDIVIGALVAGGADQQTAGWSMFSTNYYVIGFVLEEQALVAAGSAQTPEIRALKQAAATLAACHPTTAASLPAIFDTDMDKRFEFGLDLLIGGLRSRMAR